MAAAGYYNNHPAGNNKPLPSPYDTPTDEQSSFNYNSANSSHHNFNSYTDTSYSNAHDNSKPYPNVYSENIPLSDHPQPMAGSNHGHHNMHAMLQPEILPTPIPPHKSKRKPKLLYNKRGSRIPWLVYLLTTAQTGVFIGELVRNATLTKSPIEIHPQFNVMIGPSPWVLINMGARFVPCMRQLNTTITNQDGSSYMQDVRNLQFSCPNTTSLDDNAVQCSLSQLCGMGGTPDLGKGSPNQWWRFIVPIFLHAGFLHIGFNMLLQLTLGGEVERQIGPIRFFILYFCSGIFGFLLGGNYAPFGIASTGASGALFGVLAFTLIDLLYTWRDRKSPVKDLLFIGLDVIISFVLGLLPGLDNFSHIGGFLIGIAVSLVVLHSPPALRQRLENDAPYTPVSTTAGKSGMKMFAKQPVDFFKGRKPLWWVWWLIRAGVLAALVIVTVLLFRNFYVIHQECKWCKYLSCLHFKNWCDVGGLTAKNITLPAQPTSAANPTRLF